MHWGPNCTGRLVRPMGTQTSMVIVRRPEAQTRFDAAQLNLLRAQSEFEQASGCQSFPRFALVSQLWLPAAAVTRRRGEDTSVRRVPMCATSSTLSAGFVHLCL